jgi:ornithine cyclodeaminase/alanine dehydrogenase-like protein (mu-crystallin family)
VDPRRPTLRVLDGAAVEAAMPGLEERLELAELAMRALADGRAQLPPKIGVAPRPGGSFAHAMPAWLDGRDPSGAVDLLGLKWVAGFPENRSAGLPAISASVILSDPRTGVPQAIVDGGPITAQRTAAVSGVALKLFGPKPGDRPIRAAMLGAGVQARSHLPVLEHLLGGRAGLELRIHDRHPSRAEDLAREALARPGIRAAASTPSAGEAVDGAQVALTLVSFGPSETRQTLDPAWLAPDALVIAVDYDMSVPAAVARKAAIFCTDERAQFLATRASGWFSGYPDPPLTLGEALLNGPIAKGSDGRESAASGGRILVSHLGVGVADLIFAAAVLRRAAAARADGAGSG